MTTPVVAPQLSIVFIDDHNHIPGAWQIQAAASQTAGKGQFVTVSRSSGYAYVGDNVSPNRIPVGVADVSEVSESSATAGAAEIRLGWRWFYGLPMGTSTDGFTVADFAKPFYIANENTVGKLSHTGADGTLANRSLGGLVFGLDKFGLTPVCMSGPIGFRLAQAALIADNKCAASIEIAATTASMTERVLARREKLHGRITAITVTPTGALSASHSNYVTYTLAKRTSTTPGTPVTITTWTTDTIATYGGSGDWTAFVPLSLTVPSTAAADLLEDDIITLTIAATAGSVSLPHHVFDVTMQVG
jgi:hypothetical protein